MEAPSGCKIILFGNDIPLTYLIERYGKQSGCQVGHPSEPIDLESLQDSQPSVLLFPNIECLEASQALVSGLASLDIPILVCSSISDEPRARELGADHCLLHPLTYDSFLSIFAAIRLPGNT